MIRSDKASCAWFLPKTVYFAGHYNAARFISQRVPQKMPRLLRARIIRAR
jgi:hypothetical protein